MKKIIILFAFTFVAYVSQAVNYEYSLNNFSSFDWTNTLNWSPSYPGTTINAGDTVKILNGVYVDIPQGTITINGVLWIQYANSALYLKNNSNLIIGANGLIMNDWWIYCYNTSQIDVYGILDLATTTSLGSGTYLYGSSKIIIHPNGELKLTDSINMYSSWAQLTVNGLLTNDGRIWNDGTINGVGSIVSGNTTANGLIQGTGTVAPGLSPGELKTDFDYNMSSNGKLDIEIGGTIPGTEYDVLGGTGNKKLSGTLNVLLYNNYTPSIGQTYTIVEGAAITDTFTTVNYPALPNNMVWEIEYNPTSVVLEVNSATAVAEVALLNNLRFYPNPTNGNLYIAGLDMRAYKYAVYTIAGQKIESGIIADNKIKLTATSNQLLFVEVIDDKNNRVVRPINLVH